MRVDNAQLQPPFGTPPATAGSSGAPAPAPAAAGNADPPALGNCRIGLHASADPGISDAEIEEFLNLRPGIIKVLSFHSDTAIRRLMLRFLGRRGEDQRFSAEERYRFLTTILESFTTTLDLKEVLRRIVTITREEFHADRAWLIRPVTEETEFAKVIFSVTAPECGVENSDVGPVPLSGSRALIKRAMEAPHPVAVKEGDAEQRFVIQRDARPDLLFYMIDHRSHG